MPSVWDGRWLANPGAASRDIFYGLDLLQRHLLQWSVSTRAKMGLFEGWSPCSQAVQRPGEDQGWPPPGRCEGFRSGGGRATHRVRHRDTGGVDTPRSQGWVAPVCVVCANQEVQLPWSILMPTP
jgi:hypothetical protein